MAFSLPGCLEDRSAVEKKILEQDPEFKKMLDARNFLQEGIDSRYKIYVEKSKEIDAQIQALKERKAQYRAIYLEFIAKLKRQFDAEKKLLKQQLAEYHNQLDKKREKIRGVEKDLREVKSILGKKEKLELTREENQVWMNKLAVLSEQKGALDRESAILKKNIWLTELKIKVYTLRYRE